jgi:hypothetical protein
LGESAWGLVRRVNPGLGEEQPKVIREAISRAIGKKYDNGVDLRIMLFREIRSHPAIG